MKIKRILLCGATLLLACTLGTAAHASANGQNKAQNNVTTERVEQPTTKIGSENSDNQSNNQISQNQNNQSDTNDQAAQQPQTPVRHYQRIQKMQKTDYYTRIWAPRRHRQGYDIYANPYGTRANSFKPFAHQRQLSNRAIHVIREAIVNNKRWVNFRAKISGWIQDGATTRSTRWLNVPLIAQRPQLPSGCEITATTMMLRYRDGRKINKMRMARLMPRSSNPNYGFVGSPYSYSGWWIKPRPLMGIVNRFTHHKAINMTGASTRRILSQINKGIPVVIWVGAMDGFPNHALTVYGYTGHSYMYNDPWLDRREVRSFRYLNYKRAVDAISPYGALSYRK